MWNRVFITVQCPSVCLSVCPSMSPQQQTHCLLWARPAGDIDQWCMAGTQQQQHVAGECGQCHVVSMCRKLNTQTCSASYIVTVSVPEHQRKLKVLMSPRENHQLNGILLMHQPDMSERTLQPLCWLFDSSSTCTSCWAWLVLTWGWPSLHGCMVYVQGWPKKWGHKLMAIILSNVNRFQNFFTGRFLGKFAINSLLKITPHLAYVGTLFCDTLMSEKSAKRSDKLGNA